MGIEHRRADISMAEKLLNGSDVTTILEGWVANEWRSV
jgi:hypothetical protein